jgi:hypothetical protein
MTARNFLSQKLYWALSSLTSHHHFSKIIMRMPEFYSFLQFVNFSLFISYYNYAWEYAFR